jgi:hypothetical protein
LYEDDRVTFVSEPPEVEKRFREKASGRTASPKLWADAWLLALAQQAEGILITFEQALASRGAYCLLTNEWIVFSGHDWEWFQTWETRVTNPKAKTENQSNLSAVYFEVTMNVPRQSE